MPPLLRIYAVYPKEKGHVWFEGLPKIVTDSRLRFIIPYDVDKGIIMISYTEGPDAEFWMKMTSSELEQRISSEVRNLFPDRSIPRPMFLKTHAWTDGCTYWKPGRYDVVQESKHSLQPMKEKMPHLFVCSESFSLHQSWVESALEQADSLLELPVFVQGLSTN
jgi:monoamine oxidase